MPFHGTPPAIRPLAERFWEKVNKRGPDECWTWFASTNNFNRGLIRDSGKIRLASRVSWELHHKKSFPLDLDCLHTCDNPNCVNPKHLFAGTHSDNMRDAFRKGRKSTIGVKHPRARINNDIVRDIRKRYLKEGRHVLAEEYGLNPGYVYRIYNRLTWKHVA